jgi:CRP-like cAMP-binding protein
MLLNNVKTLRQQQAAPPLAPVSTWTQCNQLLLSLPPPVLERLQPALKLVWMPAGKVLHEAGDALQHVFFPTTAIVSLHCLMADGGVADLAVVGSEGMVGIACVTGGDSVPHRAVVLSGGHLWQLSGQPFRNELARCGGRRCGALSELMLRYTQALLTQTAQTAVCNRHHSVAQQLCRLLLLSADRTASPELKMTHELIANTLGVRREGVTEAAGKLQTAGVIRYRRGHITVLDRPGLEARACECYAVVRNEYTRLIPGHTARLQPQLQVA